MARPGSIRYSLTMPIRMLSLIFPLLLASGVFSRVEIGLLMKADVRMSGVGARAEVICANAEVR